MAYSETSNLVITKTLHTHMSQTNVVNVSYTNGFKTFYCSTSFKGIVDITFAKKRVSFLKCSVYIIYLLALCLLNF